MSRVLCLALAVWLPLSESILLAQQVPFRRRPFRYAAAAAGGSCATLHQDFTGHTGSTQTVGDESYTTERLFQFQATNSATICKVALRLKKNGSPTFNVLVRIRADSSDTPVTGAGLTASANLDSSTLPSADYGTNLFSVSFSMVNGTKYWVCLDSDSSAFPNANYVQIDTGTSAGLHFYDENDTDTFSNWGSAGRCWFILYKE